MEIKGKTVLVTGVSSGVGAAIAKEMALAGAGELLLLARNENELKKVAAAIASWGGKSRILSGGLVEPGSSDGNRAAHRARGDGSRYHRQQCRF
jgi:NADP-dependent 3-hydroxy acid dehydrogenase YdfG